MMSVFFFLFLKYFLEFCFFVIVDFVVLLLSLFRNIIYNGNWFFGKLDLVFKFYVFVFIISGLELYRVFKFKERY